MSRTVSQQMFAHVVGREDDDIPLDVAALLIGDWQYPDLEVSRYLSLLDDYADMARTARAGSRRRALAEIGAINRVLYGQLGFRGNDDDYYDPRNSFLHEVIERRTGIPITMTVLYMEVARRMGVTVYGVSFPGHFLARYDELGRITVLDPFRMGMILDDDALTQMLQRSMGADAALTPDLLTPATKTDILTRMLSNLAGIYSRRGEVQQALEVLERLLILHPDNARLDREIARLRDRAVDLN